MRITIYIFLLVIMSLSAIFAISGTNNEKQPNKQENKPIDPAIKTILGYNPADVHEKKADLFRRLIAFGVLTVATAALLTIYFTGGNV